MMHHSHPLAQIDFVSTNQAYVIEASAGTGKTWTIEKLYIKALLEAANPLNREEPITISNILVVTFTNDATEELKARIQEQLARTIQQLILLNNGGGNANSRGEDLFNDYLQLRLASADVHKDITVLNRAVQNFESAAIFTIHGFCKRVLEDYQFDCNSPINFELTASKDAIVHELIRDFLRQKIIAGMSGSADLQQILSNLEYFYPAKSSTETLAQRICHALPKDLFLAGQCSYQLKYTITASPSLELLKLAELTTSQVIQAKAEFLALVCEYLEHEYPKRNRNSNLLSYDELIQKVATSVSSKPALATKLFSHYPVAFIDEFQDTDALQWQIFSTIYQLASSDVRGNVVVVGDPKQAIYRFRGADVATYLTASWQIGNRLLLMHNYRAQPQIMNFINRLFELSNQNSTLTESFLGSGIDYVAVEARGKDTTWLPTANQLQHTSGLLAAHYQFYDEPVQIVTVRGAKAQQRKDAVLQNMTLEILALLRHDPSLKGKIAILVTKNREASEVVKFLRTYGVKASELKLGNIFATSTAADLYQILLAISDLSNRKNLNHALATKLLNLPLTLLRNQAQTAGLNLDLAYRQFYRYKEIWQQQGLIALIYSLLNDVCTNHQEAAGVLTNRELANLWQLAELLHKQAAIVHSQSELIHWFGTKLKTAALAVVTDLEGNSEELIRLESDEEQIVITTQHKAKGLEYEILFCPFFKSNAKVDNTFDLSYQRPFFNSWQDEHGAKAQLILEKSLAEAIVTNDNKEIHRLNYVALTRAKSRVYLYLKQPGLTSKGTYLARERTDKLHELFGYVAYDPADTSHPLFCYPLLFSDNPQAALKQPSLFPGVAIYGRTTLEPQLLASLSYRAPETANLNRQAPPTTVAIEPCLAYFRQSYTQLSSSKAQPASELSVEYYVKNEASPQSQPEYQYSLLHDSQIGGAQFGILFHDLCEKYPLTAQQLEAAAAKINLNLTTTNYREELAAMVNATFNYPLMPGLCLAQLSSYVREMEFNLRIDQGVALNQQLAELISDHFGRNHPFSQAVRTLARIEPGFLVGFIDLLFEFQGRYWVLDYKTNRLDNYQAPTDNSDANNSIIQSMAEHHYYLQYLLYLVAVKRFLETRLALSDASHLLGGAIYLYVRGIFVTNREAGSGVFIDQQCQQLVAKLDQLLRGNQ